LIMRVQERKFLTVSNYFFTVLFALEMMIKVCKISVSHFTSVFSLTLCVPFLRQL